MANDINEALGLATSKPTDTTNQGFLKKYPALRTLSGIIAFIAWTIPVLTLIIVIALLSKSEGESSWLLSVGTLAVGAIFFIALLAYSEIIKVFVDIEENTRKAAASTK